MHFPRAILCPNMKLTQFLTNIFLFVLVVLCFFVFYPFVSFLHGFLFPNFILSPTPRFPPRSSTTWFARSTSAPPPRSQRAGGPAAEDQTQTGGGGDAGYYEHFPNAKTQKNQNILYRASQTAIWESGYGKGKTFFSRKG